MSLVSVTAWDEYGFCIAWSPTLFIQLWHNLNIICFPTTKHLGFLAKVLFDKIVLFTQRQTQINLLCRGIIKSVSVRDDIPKHLNFCSWDIFSNTSRNELKIINFLPCLLSFLFCLRTLNIYIFTNRDILYSVVGLIAIFFAVIYAAYVMTLRKKKFSWICVFLKLSNQINDVFIFLDEIL